MKKTVTILQTIVALIVIASGVAYLIAKFSIPGLIPLGCAIIMLGQWYRTKLELKEGKVKKENVKLIIVISLIAFAIGLVAGIGQIVSAIT